MEDHPINLYMSMGFSDGEWGETYFLFRRFFTENQLLTLRQLFLFKAGDSQTLSSDDARDILQHFFKNGVYDESALRAEIDTMSRSDGHVSFAQFLHVNLRLKQASGDVPAEGVFAQEDVFEVQAETADSRSVHTVTQSESEELASWVESALTPFRSQDALLMEVLPFGGNFSPELFLDGRLYVRLLTYLVPGSIADAPSPRVGRLKRGAQAFHALNRMTRVLDALRGLGRNIGSWAAADLVQNNPHTVFAVLKHIRAASKTGDMPIAEVKLDTALKQTVGEWARKRVSTPALPDPTGSSRSNSQAVIETSGEPKTPVVEKKPEEKKQDEKKQQDEKKLEDEKNAALQELNEKKESIAALERKSKQEIAAMQALKESEKHLREELERAVVRQKQLEMDFDADERRIHLLEAQLNSQSEHHQRDVGDQLALQKESESQLETQQRTIENLRQEVALQKDSESQLESQQRAIDELRKEVEELRKDASARKKSEKELRRREELAMKRELELDTLSSELDRREKELISLQTELEERKSGEELPAEVLAPPPSPMSSSTSSGAALSTSSPKPTSNPPRRWLLAYDGKQMAPLWHCLESLTPQDTLVVFNAGASESDGVLEGIREKMLAKVEEATWPVIVFEFVVTGHAGAAVLHAAQQNRCSAVVLGHSRKSALKKIAEGSVTSFLLKHMREDDIRLIIVQ